MAPRDEAMLVHMLRTAIAHDGPAALRYPRGPPRASSCPPSRRDPDRQRRGAGERRAGRAARLRLRRRRGAARRRRSSPPRPAADRRRRRFAKPLDDELLERLALGHDLVVTIEENVLPGGFGSAVLEHLEDAFADRPRERARVMRIGCRTATSPTASLRCCARRSA
jgi:1-deoxy-D-xylulose-5-phosphate synthase